MNKEYLIEVGNEQFTFKNAQEAFTFYDKKKEETKETCCLMEITTKELDFRHHSEC